VIAVIDPTCSLREKAEVVRFVESRGLRVQVSETGGESLLAVIGEPPAELADALEAMPVVREVRRDSPPYALVARGNRVETSRVRVADVHIGDSPVVVIAGPCAVESREGLLEIAAEVAGAGASILRGGAFKPRTSPYSFQGLGREGLEFLAEARSVTGLPVVTEVVASEDVALVAEFADMLQIGARNMQNFRLLSAAGEQPRPVLLKRGLMATIDELLLAAEYVVSAGNPRVVLCERGIRTFERATRNTLDICAVPLLKERSHLPVIVDPSHAAGRRDLVPALACAAVAAGADGLMIEAHPNPDAALSDGPQSLWPADLRTLIERLDDIATAVGRSLRRPASPPDTESAHEAR
jgi:3-deoxy-7-phosphoheptulonate synthase